MKLCAIRSFNEQDPLPTLGAKVEPKQPAPKVEAPKRSPTNPDIFVGPDGKMETRIPKNVFVGAFDTGDTKRVRMGQRATTLRIKDMLPDDHTELLAPAPAAFAFSSTLEKLAARVRAETAVFAEAERRVLARATNYKF